MTPDEIDDMSVGIVVGVLIFLLAVILSIVDQQLL